MSDEDRSQMDVDGTIDIARNPSPKGEEKELSSLQVERYRRGNENLRGDIAQKRAYFSVTRKLTRHWIIFIVAMVVAQFLARLAGKGFEAAEFIALITTTTATLVGFWAIVGAYLFPRRKD